MVLGNFSCAYQSFIYLLLGFCDGSAGKKSTCNVGDLGSIPGLGRSPGEGNSYPLWYSGLENSMDCIVHGVAKSQTQTNNFHFLSSFTGSFFISRLKKIIIIRGFKTQEGISRITQADSFLKGKFHEWGNLVSF